MLIRHAEAGRDAAACAAIYAPFVLGSAVSFEEEAPGAPQMAGRIERISIGHPWLVAEEDDHVVGFAYATHHRERAGYRWAADTTVYVHAEYGRRGIGSALYRALLELLVRQGIQIACAGITLPNEASVALHESLGFVHVGTYHRIGWKAGAWRDVGWWELELLPPTPGAPAEPGPPVRLQEG